MANYQQLNCGDCLSIMRDMPDDSVDLTFTSPPYENCRTYGIDFDIKDQAWVDWAVERYKECVRVTRGLVAWVVAGKTSNFRWSATPALLLADLHRAGIKLRTPPIFHRVGIPGSGGPDWLRNDYEFIVCASKGRLPWSDNTAGGSACKFAPGGTASHRIRDGQRCSGHEYKPPKKANPGNRIEQRYEYTASEMCRILDTESDLTHHIVGGGVMGSRLCHENEAPFPESLAEFFIRSFCPVDGVVLDPFCGSGTTLSVAKKNLRSSRGIDIRQSQIDLTLRRLAE